MNKKIVLCGVFFSSCMFGMEESDRPLKLECQVEGTIKALFPITFKEASSGSYYSHPSATIVECKLPDDFDVQLPKDAYTYLSENKMTTYVNSILDKQQTIDALRNLLKKDKKIDFIIMTIHSPYAGEGPKLLREYSFFLEASELPQSIKKECNIKSMSRTDMLTYSLIPILCFCALLVYCPR